MAAALLSPTGGKRTPMNALKSALQAMHSDDHTPGQYRDCQHPNPTAVSPLGSNFGVEDETDFAADRIGPHFFQSAFRTVTIARHCPVAVDRRPRWKAEQLVD